jgi:hypothetical protein
VEALPNTDLLGVRVCDLYRVEAGRDFERIPALVADLAA